ncbi:MAG: transcriptional regulator [Myxococcales bacterium]|nr:transcriptional regulator [Myxococcales bacterium]
MSGDDPAAALQALLDVDRTVHEPARLVILGHLYAVDGADFLYLRRATGLTAGNISSHITRLEDAGLVSVKKSFEGRRPRTALRLTAAGRRALRDYVGVMAAALDVMAID